MGETHSFKVVKIIDDLTLVIDGGDAQGVKKNQTYEIYVKGSVVRNLEGESIGTLDMVKAYIKPRDVFENMSICENAETRPLSSFMELFEDGKTALKRVPCNLPINAEDISGGWPDGVKKTICVGDLVRPSRG